MLAVNKRLLQSCIPQPVSSCATPVHPLEGGAAHGERLGVIALCRLQASKDGRRQGAGESKPPEAGLRRAGRDSAAPQPPGVAAGSRRCIVARAQVGTGCGHLPGELCSMPAGHQAPCRRTSTARLEQAASLTGATAKGAYSAAAAAPAAGAPGSGAAAACALGLWLAAFGAAAAAAAAALALVFLFACWSLAAGAGCSAFCCCGGGWPSCSPCCPPVTAREGEEGQGRQAACTCCWARRWEEEGEEGGAVTPVLAAESTAAISGAAGADAAAVCQGAG
jgi:hypothetical protein